MKTHINPFILVVGVIASNIILYIIFLIILITAIGLSLSDNMGLQLIVAFFYAVGYSFLVPIFLLIGSVVYYFKKKTEKSKITLITQSVLTILVLIIVLPFSFFLLDGKGSNEDSIDVELYPIEDISVSPLDTISDENNLMHKNQDSEDF